MLSVRGYALEQTPQLRPLHLESQCQLSELVLIGVVQIYCGDETGLDDGRGVVCQVQPLQKRPDPLARLGALCEQLRRTSGASGADPTRDTHRARVPLARRRRTWRDAAEL